MLKRVILALMLIVALLVTSGCGLIVKDPEVDRQTVIIEVAGKTFTKGEVQMQLNYTLYNQAYMYQMYGMAFDPTDPATLASAQQQTLDGMVRQAVVDQKEAEMGMLNFTDEELTELQTKVDESYASNTESVKTQYFAETELTGEELDKAIEAKMLEVGYGDKDSMLENEKANKAYEKLRAEVVKGVQVTDEEIQAKYDEKLASAKSMYESSLPSYGTEVRQGNTVYYRPAGYRYVKNLLRKLSEEDTTAINDLQTQITEKQSQLSTVDASLAELPVDAAQDSEPEAQSRKELETTKTTLTAEVGDLQAQLDATKEAAYAKVQPAIDEVLQKLSEGGNFDALMEEYGEDDGMKASPAKEEGYLVCAGDTTWVTEFTEAAMALAKVGDVSAPVRTSFGIHLLSYVSDLPEGDVPLSDVKDALTQEILTAKQDELFEATQDEWVKEAGAKVYADRMK